MKYLLFLSLFIFHSSMAQDFSVWGTVYPIQEENLLMVITQRAQDLKFDKIKLNHHLNHPKPVENIRTTQASRTRVVDPSVRFQNKTINPLAKVQLTTPLLFIDGAKTNQQAWVEAMIQQAPQSKVILVNGNPTALSQRWQRPVYFDQGGQLVKRFNINSVPARVTQQGLHLKLEEVAL